MPALFPKRKKKRETAANDAENIFIQNGRTTRLGVQCGAGQGFAHCAVPFRIRTDESARQKPCSLLRPCAVENGFSVVQVLYHPCQNSFGMVGRTGTGGTVPVRKPFNEISSKGPGLVWLWLAACQFGTKYAGERARARARARALVPVAQTRTVQEGMRSYQRAICAAYRGIPRIYARKRRQSTAMESKVEWQTSFDSLWFTSLQ